MEMIQQPDTFASRHRGFTRSILTSAQGLVASCLQCWVLLISTEHLRRQLGTVRPSIGFF